MGKSKQATAIPVPKKKLGQRIFKSRTLYLMLLPAFIITLIFNYLPIGGIIIAFKRYSAGKGIWGSRWVGLRWFIQFFENPYAFRLISNTLILGFESFLITFPAPILLALLFNELKNERFKRIAQSVSYIPHFISTIVIVGMLKNFTAQTGWVNSLITALGGESIIFFTRSEWFRPLYITSGLWQGIGWGTIIYLAALSGISPELYEAGELDGASRFQKIRYITLPEIMPVIITLFILSIPSLINVDTEKILLMYSPSTYSTADVIGTYTYREGIENANYSYSTAINLATSLVSFALLFVTNWTSKKLSDNSLW